MKQSEKIVLDTLRKTSLAYLSENEYNALEKAVETEGITNLTGTAATIIKAAVLKHASHDQSSHGSWAGGGMGGGGASTGSNANNTMLERGKKALEGRSYEAMMRDYDKMEEKWRKKLSGPYDPENEEYGDPQDLAQADFYRKYGAFPMDVQYYAGAMG